MMKKSNKLAFVLVGCLLASKITLAQDDSEQSSEAVNSVPVEAAQQTQEADGSTLLDAAQTAGAQDKGVAVDIPDVQDVEVDPDEVFQESYAKFKEKQWEEAGSGFLTYIKLTSPDVRNYEWAEFFLGISLDNLGFTHAAVDRLSNLTARKPNTKIVTYVLDMFEQISRTRPFDYDQVILQVVNDKDYGFINGDINSFIHYYQGIQDWKTGHRDWAADHFDLIDEESYYYNRYMYHQAVYQIEIGKPKEAIKQIGQLLSREDVDQDLMDEALWTAARLHYELEEFEEASFLYKKIKKPIVEQASFLLEQAWIEYQKENFEKAMGFLYAFEAPTFRQFFTPEYYILKSFIYKDVCHYESALSVVGEFQSRYGVSLDAIYNRKDERDVEGEELLFVILAKKSVKKIWDFIRSLEAELELLDKLDDEELMTYIESVYALQLDESSYLFRNMVEEEYKKKANVLLQYEEESHLMRYEIGVDLYQTVAETGWGNKAKEKKKKAEETNTVTFSFQKEYWNDELGNYRVTLPNKCENFKDWDLFFE